MVTLLLTNGYALMSERVTRFLGKVCIIEQHISILIYRVIVGVVRCCLFIFFNQIASLYALLAFFHGV